MKIRAQQWFSYLLLVPVVLPLVYLDGLLYPYVTLKTLLFRASAIVALGMFAWLVLSGRSFFWGRLRDRWTWIPGGLLVVAYITSAFGVNFYRSFWSSFERGDGLLTLTAAVVFFYLLVLHADRQFLRRFFMLVGWVGSLVALYTVLQWLQSTTHINIPLIAEPRGRFGSTLGNAAFLAAYLGMTLFATLGAARDYTGKMRRSMYAGMVLQGIAIVLAATRGTLLALVVIGLIVAFRLAFFSKGKTRTLARTGLGALLVLIAVFFIFRAPLSRAPFEPVRRMASISLADTTVSSRLFVWQEVLQETLKRPLLGYGAEHVSFLFNRVYDPTQITEEWFDRSHNAFLDYFAQYGLGGLLLYIGLIGALVQKGFRLWRSGDRYGTLFMSIAAVYAMQNFFVFDTAMTLYLLLAFLGVVIAYMNPVLARPAFSPIPNVVSAITALVILIPLYYVFFVPIRANRLLAQGYTYHVSDVTRAISLMERGRALNTYADVEYGYQAYTMYAEEQHTMLEGAERIAAYRYASQVLHENFNRYPFDARTAIYLAHVLDLAPPEETADETLSKEALNRAIALSPKRSQAWYLLANIDIRKGNRAQTTAEKKQHYLDAIAILEKYSPTVPHLTRPYFAIANLYLGIEDRVNAERWANKWLLQYKGDGGTARQAISTFINLQDWHNAARLLEDIVRGDPNDYDSFYDLAKASFLAGNRARAEEIVAMLRREKPGLVETDPAFLKELEK